MKNLLTKEAFAEWCEKQPADEKYNYINNRDCPIFRYLKFAGFQPFSVGPDGWATRGWFGLRLVEHDLPAGWNGAAVSRPNTFGALATRLRESQP